MGKPYDCPKCGEVHPRGCKKHVRRCAKCESATAYGLTTCPKCGGTDIDEERPCRKPARDGAGACETHGGKSSRITNALDRRDAEAKALTILGREGVQPLGHPVEELLHHMAVLKTAEAIIRDRIGDLSASDLSSAEVAAWERTSDRLTQRLVDLTRLGLEQRKVQIDEAKAALVGDRVNLALQEWAEELKSLLPEHHALIDSHLSTLPTTLRRHLLGEQESTGYNKGQASS